MRIDAHHHFWELGRYDYPWIGPEAGPLRRNYGPHDLKPELERSGIGHTVLVQTISSVPETRWFLNLAAEHPWIAGVVGWVDLASPTVGELLDELAQDPRLVGIRHNVHDEPDERWLVRDDVKRGLSELAARGFSYDLLLRPQHLAPACEVAEALPELMFVVDHIAKPNISGRGWTGWAEGLSRLARLPNVYCKLSGMITEANWNAWTATDLKPYIEHAIECFGSARLMYGSDWPVCRLAGTYSAEFEAVLVNIAQLSASEQDEILGGTAKRFYRLSV